MNALIYFIIIIIIRKLLQNQTSCFYDEILINNYCISKRILILGSSNLVENCLTCKLLNNYQCLECLPEFIPIFDPTNTYIKSCISNCTGVYNEYMDIYTSKIKENCFCIYVIKLVSQWAYRQSNLSSIDSQNPIRRPTSDSERNALVQFYISLNGDFWINNNNWRFDDPCTVHVNINYRIIGMEFIAINMVI